MPISDNAKKLKLLRSRSIGLRELAAAIEWSPSKYQYYERGFKKPYLPREFIELIAPHIVGGGDPPVTKDELFSLTTGAAPVGEIAHRAQTLSANVQDFVHKRVNKSTDLHSNNDTKVAALTMWKSASGAFGRAGAFVLTKQKTGETPRDDRVRYSDQAFSFKIIEDANEPAFRQRDVIVVDPESAPLPRDFCVFLDRRHVIEGSPTMVGELVQVTATHWVVKQVRSTTTAKLLRKEWPDAWPIVVHYPHR